MDSAKQSLEGLTPQLGAVNAKFKDLQKKFEPLPPDLPGFTDVRSKFYGTAEALGRMGAKIPWLSGRLDSAVKAGNSQELQEISKDIAKTSDELKQIDQIALELVHEVAPFEKMLASENAAASAPFTRVLSTGYEVKAVQEGLEQRLLELIEGSANKGDAAAWLDFDRVVFAGDSAALDEGSSKSQLENLVALLAAYPKVKLKIGGYTGTDGAAADKKLSADRVQSVKEALVRLGAPAPRLSAAGGSAKLVCVADEKSECRAGGVAAQITAK